MTFDTILIPDIRNDAQTDIGMARAEIWNALSKPKRTKTNRCPDSQHIAFPLWEQLVCASSQTVESLSNMWQVRLADARDLKTAGTTYKQ
jgi:hypothetical protein